MENAAQFFNNALATSQLAVLPTFSDKKNEDKYNSAQWLQKILNHRAGTEWNDQQFITHVRNALRGDMIDWFDGLKPMKVDITVWANIQRVFEVDFEAAPTASSVVNRIPTIKQGEQESVVKYISRSLKIMEEFKTKVDHTQFTTPALVLVAGAAGFAGQADFNALPADYKAALDLHTRKHTTDQALDNVGVILMTSGLRPDLRTEVLKRDVPLITVADIKAVALKSERLQQEKLSKSAAKVNGNSHSIDAISSARGNNNRGRGGQPRGEHTSSHYQGSYQSQSGQQQQSQQTQRGAQRGGRGRGQPARGGQGGANGAQATQSQDTRPKCVFCGMRNHPTEKCFKLLDHVKARNEATPRRVNQVEPENHEEDQYADEEFYEENNTEPISAIFTRKQSKN
jgi:hypothetical protein